VASGYSSLLRAAIEWIPQRIRSSPWSLIAAAVLSCLLFVDIPFEDSYRSLNAFWNLGHIPLFALFARLFFVDNRALQHYTMAQRLAACVLASAVLGALVELLQYGLARNMDLADVYRDVLGALLGFIFSPLGISAIKAGLMRAGVALLLLFQLQPLAAALVDEQRARSAFPLLSGFEMQAELGRWRSGENQRLSADQVYSGNSSLRFTTDTQSYSGISLAYFPGNWSAYQQLSLAVYSEQEGLVMTLRIHDSQHLQGPQRYQDRFNRSFTLNQGWNQLTVPLTEVAAAPLDRRLDLQQVAGLGLFVVRQRLARTFYLDQVQLLR
jgi:VanZ family protein